MPNIRIKLPYLDETVDALRSHYHKLKSLAEIGEGAKNTGKRFADGMLKSAREYYWEIKRDMTDADKASNDNKLLERRMTSIEGYSKKIYNICRYNFRDER